MAPRFDADRRTLELSVADLLDSRQLRHLGFANRGGYERLWLGQAIHSSYQEAALETDGSYQREVVLRAELEHKGWQVKVQGRADGLRKDIDGTLVVEEIKSVRRDGQLSAAARKIYEQQALIYAWMLHRSGAPGDDLRAELVLIEIGSDLVERCPLEGDLDLLEAVILRRISALIRVYESEAQALDERRRAAGEIAFPYPERRPGQEEILEAVEHAVEHGEHLLLEATTGIGKTVATLYPALRYCLAHDKRLFVLTAKTLQQEMAGQVLELLDAGKSFQALRIRAKAKMCANDQVLCHEDYCPYAKDYYTKLQGSSVLEEIQEGAYALDPDAIFALAKHAEVCPFEVTLELGGRSQVTVCDYNYAFEPYVALSDFGKDTDLGNTVLVVDEIHNLVDRGRGYYSPQLSARVCRRAAEAMRYRGQPIHFELERLALSLADLIDRTGEEALGDLPESVPAAEVALPEEALWRLRPELDAAFIDYLEFQRTTKTLSADDPFVDLYFQVLRFLNGLVRSTTAAEVFAHCVERRDSGYRLRILCKDPSPFLGDVIHRCHAVIGLSATLSPSDFYRDLLGFDPERTAAVSIPDPFPEENRRVVVDNQVTTTYRERPENYPLIAESLARFADAVPGNCLALFPSYVFLAEVAAQMPAGAKRVLVQRRADGDEERQEILQTLRTAVLGDVLLLAVAGGVFAEGVDYPGDMLRAVAVVGPCLPAVTLEQQLLKDYYDERFERGFEYAFVVPGMTRVVQAAGRLIRSAEDTGVIALFDRRFLRHPYQRHLPAGWRPDGPLKALAGYPAQAAAEFFAELQGEHLKVPSLES